MLLQPSAAPTPAGLDERQLLTDHENSLLLRLLFNCDSKTFAAIRTEFASAFPQHDDRLRAGVAALALLEDSRAFSTAQRLGAWFSLLATWDAPLCASASPHQPSAAAPALAAEVLVPPASVAPLARHNPFVHYVVEVAGDERRSAVERHLVLQLLHGYQVQQLDSTTPLNYALSYSLPLTRVPPDLQALRAQFSHEAPASTMAPATGPGAAPLPADLDLVLQQRRQQLDSMALTLLPGPAATKPAGPRYASPLLPAGPPTAPLGAFPLAHHANSNGINHSPPQQQQQQSLHRAVPWHAQDANTPLGTQPPPLDVPRPGGGGPSSHPLVLHSQPAASHQAAPNSSGTAVLGGRGTGGGPGGSEQGSSSGEPVHEVWAGDSSAASSQQGDVGGAAPPHRGSGGGGGGGGSGGGVAAAAANVQQLDAGAEAAACDLVLRALQGPLLPAQQAVVQSALQADPSVAARLGVGPPQLPLLVEHAPALAVDLLTALAASPLLPPLLETLARCDMSLHGMEVVNRLTGCMELPTEFLHLYIANCIHSCEAQPDKYVQSRLVRLLCVFLQSLIRSRVVNIADLLHEVQSFCVNFSRVREAAKLFRLLKQFEANGRLALVGLDGLGSPTGPEGASGVGGDSASGAVEDAGV